MNRTKIEWCDFTWNPVTGCKRGCPYCYAKRVHNRFNKEPFDKITFHPERLMEPLKVKKPSKIFVGSMSDIEYWDLLWTKMILDVVEANQQHTFMFLSKRPSNYNNFDWPQNAMTGITITSGPILSDTIQFFEIYRSKFMIRPFLSIEPLLGPVPAIMDKFELVIIGAQTGPKAIVPKDEWVEEIVRIVPPEKLFVKDSIKEQFNRVTKRRSA